MTEIKGPLLLYPDEGLCGEGDERKFYSNIPIEIWDTFKDEFTLNGQIEIIKWFKDGTSETDKSIVEKKNWTNEKLLKFKEYYNTENIIKKANNRLKLPEMFNENYREWGKPISFFLNNIFLKYENKIRGKKIAVLGSMRPWVEGICLNYEPKLVKTIEYNLPIIDDDSLVEVELYDDFCKSNEQYDVIIQISSIEHSGLGRYGDYIDPTGDLKTMEQFHKHLSDDGIVIWCSPVHGKDYLGWNVHRVYGPIRLPLIFKNFEELEWFPVSKKEIMSKTNNTLCAKQPIIVLKKK